MKVGLIARSEDRGLGVMTWAFWRHMRPERTLLISPLPNISKGFRQHAARYRGGGPVTWLAWDGGALDEISVRRFLRGLDVLYTAETFYDPRLPEWARDEGVATVLHAMPEFYNAELPPPTALWLPTPWRADEIDGAQVVPVPVERAHEPATRISGAPLRILHVAGHRALADRNGTLTFLAALRHVRHAMHATVVCQDARLPQARVSPSVKFKRMLRHESPLDPLYAEHDVVVLPRKYGGLCLPAQEALSYGRALVMPNVPPNPEWPIVPIPSTLGPDSIRTVAGEIPVARVAPHHLARILDAMASDPAIVEAKQEQAREWARAHSWDAWRDRYREALAAARAVAA